MFRKKNSFKNDDLKDLLKKSFQSFSAGTSFHGFAELYNSKSFIWTSCWVIILFGAFAVTTYQVNNAISQYLNNPTTTVMTPANENEILYPPLRICYMHMLFWVDWKKATSSSANITKDTLLFGLNYFNYVFSTYKFDMIETEKKFESMMKAKNFTSMFDFFKSLARAIPITGDYNLVTYFDTVDIFYKEPGFLYCYEISPYQMIQFFNRNQNVFETTGKGKVISFTTMDETYTKIKEYFTKDEYIRFMLRWIEKKSMYKVDKNYTGEDLLDFAPPILIYPNGFSKKSVDIFTENDLYDIHLQASARTLKNVPQKPCLEGYQSFSSNDSCEIKCLSVYRKSVCSCLSLDDYIVLDDNATDKLCEKGILFMSPSGDKEVTFSNRTYPKQNCSKDEQATVDLANCKKACIPPCMLWTYDVSATVTKMSSVVRNIGRKVSTNITIEYPTGSHIVVMTEVDFQTFENFVANVGGLLGIWTGASIVSFFQVFYLCCCANMEKTCSYNGLKSLKERLRCKKKVKPLNLQSVHVC